jgi:hypothetical protein
MATVFEARYHSTCGVCLEPIEPGDEVTWEDDEVVHEDCADFDPEF